MSQENNGGARQRATQQVQMTQEELQRTQVLNLQAVEEAARFERRTSKKPAIFVGVLGILLLLFGSSYQVVNHFRALQEEKKIENRKTEVKKESKKEVICKKTGVDTEKGVDTDYTIQYTFEEKVLTTIVKTHIVKATDGSELGKKEVEALLSAYQPFLVSMEGYQVTVVPNEEKTELTTTTTVQFQELSRESFPEFQQGYFTTSIDFDENSDEMTVKTKMTNEGFTCQ